MGTQVDVVCKGRGKECEEGAENEGGAHREAKTLRANDRRVFRAGSPDRFKVSEAESSQKRRLTRQVDTRDIFFQLASESRDLQGHARKGNYSART